MVLMPLLLKLDQSSPRGASSEMICETGRPPQALAREAGDPSASIVTGLLLPSTARGGWAERWGLAAGVEAWGKSWATETEDVAEGGIKALTGTLFAQVERTSVQPLGSAPTGSHQFTF